MNPNHFLAVAVWHLFSHRPHWPAAASVGKTLVSSSMIDRVAAHLGRGVTEVPVGFKWFVDGLLSGACAFACEESAGAAFLRRDGTVWVTDKDGFIMDLLAAEITAVHGKDPGECYRALEREHGRAWYARIDAAASKPQRDTLARLSPSQVTRHRAGRRPDPREAHARAGQRRADRRAEGHDRARAGSPRAPRAPRTSTRSTPRASGARSTCAGSSRRRRRSSPRPCRPDLFAPAQLKVTTWVWPKSFEHSPDHRVPAATLATSAAVSPILCE